MPGFARDARPRVRHVHRGRLVPRVHEVEPDVERRVEHGHDVVAREREDVPHARVGERAYQGVGAAHAESTSEPERRRQQLVRATPRGGVERPGVDDELDQLEALRQRREARGHLLRGADERLAAQLVDPRQLLRRYKDAPPPARARPADGAGPARNRRARIRASSGGAALRLRCRPQGPTRRSSRSARDSVRWGGSFADRACSASSTPCAVAEEIGERVGQAEMRGEARPVIGAAENPDLGTGRALRLRRDAAERVIFRQWRPRDPALQLVHLPRELIGRIGVRVERNAPSAGPTQARGPRRGRCVPARWLPARETARPP